MSLFKQSLLLGAALLSVLSTAIPVDSANPSDQVLKWAVGGHKITDCNTCDAKIQLDKTHPQLPPPHKGLKLKHVVIGRGTQNYTCATGNDASITPESAGAVATLYDTSCLASKSPKVMHRLSEELEKIDSGALTSVAGLVNDVAGIDLIGGVHYFDETKSPVFDFRQHGSPNWITTAGVEKVPSPNGAVDWLKLGRKESTGLKEVFRVETNGGQPPATCAESPETFEVEYSAEYWFYG